MAPTNHQGIPPGPSDATLPAAPAARSPLAGAARIAAFFGLLGFAVLAADGLVRSGFRKIPTSHFGVSNRIATGSVNASIVITGSSRAVVHYDPRIIQAATGTPAFNIGKNGSQTDLQVAVLKFYLQHNARPKLVIHNLDPYSLQVSNEIYDVAQYFPYLQEPPIFAAVARVYPEAWKWRLFPLYGYLVEDLRLTWMQGLKAHFSFFPREDHFLGFTPRNLRWTGDFAAYRAANPNGVRFAVEDAGISSLRELAEICRAQAIPLLFVFSPEYSEMQKMEKNREEIFSQFRAIAAEFGVLFWDYSDSPLGTEQRYFYNSQHLNAEGAAAFSADLAKRLADRMRAPGGLLRPN